MKIKQVERYKQNIKQKIRELERYITETEYTMHHVTSIHQKHEADPNEENIEVYHCNKVYMAEDLIGLMMDMIKELEIVEKKLITAKREIGLFEFEEKRENMKLLLSTLKDMSKATGKTGDEKQTSYRLDEGGNPVLYEYNVHHEAEIEFDHEWAVEMYTKIKEGFEEEEEQILRKKALYDVNYIPKYQLDLPINDNMKIYLESR